MILSPHFYGPYKVLARIGIVSYRLELPSNARIHPVFHVSQLKKTLGRQNHTVDELLWISYEGVVEEPAWIWDFRWVKHRGTVLQEALVQWIGLHLDDLTWERYSNLQQQFPHLNLEDKFRLQGERNIMTRVMSEDMVSDDVVSARVQQQLWI